MLKFISFLGRSSALVLVIFGYCQFSEAEPLGSSVDKTYLVRINLVLPDNYQLNGKAPSSALVVVQHSAGTTEQKIDLQKLSEEVRLDIPADSQVGLVSADLTVFYCRKDKTGQCLFASVSESRPEDNQDDNVSDFKFEIKLANPQ